MIQIVVNKENLGQFVETLSRYAFFLGINLSDKFCEEVAQKFGKNPSGVELSTYFETFYKEFENEIFNKVAKKVGLKKVSKCF